MADAAILLNELPGSIALMGLLAVAYGVIVRRLACPSQARIVLGLLFGAAASGAMLDRIPVAEGVFVDLRHLPVALAGAFLGWRGAAVTLAMAVAMRIGLGGAGALSGTVGILIAGTAALLWHRWTVGVPRRDLRSMLGLALLTSAYPAGLLLLPAPIVGHALTLALTVTVPLHVLGILVVGTLIERERILYAREMLLLRDADHDPLTGLLNRRGFERAVARLPEERTGALLLLDLDHFKRVNDVHGHVAGDVVLRATAQRIASRLGRGDLLARLGGEEIAIFLPGQSSEGARATARALCEAMRSEAFSLPEGGAIRVTTSVGGAWGSTATLDLLMARADIALYAAKHAGRDRCRFAAERPVLVDGAAPGTESACADCALHLSCCEGREDGEVPGPANRAVA